MTRLWAGIALAVALIAAGWFGFRSAYGKGREAGQAAVRAEWDADRARLAAAHSAALVASHEAYRRDLARREEVERGLDAKLSAADARGRNLARRLRDARGPAGACPVPGAGHDTAARADGAAGEPGDGGEVEAALAAHLAACDRDATRLGELQRFLTR